MGSAALFGCASPEKNPPTILWGESQNGLSLGTQEPLSPLVFEPTKGWRGPLTLTQKGGFPISNPGGQWSKTALIKVFIKNTSDHIIWWSSDHDVWEVRVSKPGVPQPQPTFWPIPAPPRNGPLPLAPGEQKEMEFNLNEAGGIWPLIPIGKYTVTVTYSPNRLLTYATGGEGHWTHPHDVPNFWRGIISTPELHIRVTYP